MKVSKLVRRLGREIEQKQMTRDELLEAVLALNEELRELDSQRDVVAGLEARYATPRDAEADAPVPAEVARETPPAPSVAISPSDDGIPVTWPLGPHYQKQFKVKSRQAWALYKLSSADWYLSTLGDVVAGIGKLDRLMGVEMAIDGALQALCGAFDAAVYALSSTLDTVTSHPGEHIGHTSQPGWDEVVERASSFGIELLCAPLVAVALESEDPGSPEGWLAQLLLLRQRGAQHDLLVRHWRVGGDAPLLCLDVPFVGPLEPLVYLSDVRDLLEQLLEVMLDDQELLRRRRPYASDRPRSGPESELPDLLRRARVTGRG